jgi:hypothetical protein
MIIRDAPAMQAPTAPTRRVALAFCALGLAWIAVGCTEKVVAPPPPPPVLGVPDSIQQVFTENCALAGCHTGPTPQQGQDLTDAVTSYANIVGVASHERSQFLRIAPGDSANSYMVMKLRNAAAIGGQPMPFGGYPMDPALVIRIAAWAQQGAPGVPVSAARRTTGWTAHR